MGLPFWRDLSLILLILEAFVLALPFIVIGYYAIKGLRLARAWLASRFPQWQALATQGRDLVAKYAAFIAAPVMAVAALFASIAAVASALAPDRYGSARSASYGRR